MSPTLYISPHLVRLRKTSYFFVFFHVSGLAGWLFVHCWVLINKFPKPSAFLAHKQWTKTKGFFKSIHIQCTYKWSKGEPSLSSWQINIKTHHKRITVKNWLSKCQKSTNNIIHIYIVSNNIIRAIIKLVFAAIIWHFYYSSFFPRVFEIRRWNSLLPARKVIII